MQNHINTGSVGSYSAKRSILKNLNLDRNEHLTVLFGNVKVETQ
jgi:hypothetical protein